MEVGSPSCRTARVRSVRAASEGRKTAEAMPQLGKAALRCRPPSRAFEIGLVHGLAGLDHREPYRTAQSEAVGRSAYVSHRFAVTKDRLGVEHQRLWVLHEDLH